MERTSAKPLETRRRVMRLFSVTLFLFSLGSPLVARLPRGGGGSGILPGGPNSGEAIGVSISPPPTARLRP